MKKETDKKTEKKYLIKIDPTRLFGPTRLIGTLEQGTQLVSKSEQNANPVNIDPI